MTDLPDWDSGDDLRGKGVREDGGQEEGWEEEEGGPQEEVGCPMLGG